MKKTSILFAIFLAFIVNAQTWNLNGNSGTNPLINYIGTTDSTDFILKTNGSESLRLLSNGNVYLSVPTSRANYPIDYSYRFINSGSTAFYVTSNSPNYFLMKDLRTNKNHIRIATSHTSDSSIFLQENGGNVLVGTGNNLTNCTSCVGYKLFVKDGIKTEKVKVEFANVNGWADYVFEKDYKLMPLKDMKNFITENRHLPEVPTAKEVVENGLELKEFSALLLKKVEELTLHIIQLNDNIEQQNLRIKDLENKKQ